MKKLKNIIMVLLISFGLFLILAMFSMHNLDYGIIEDKYSYTNGSDTCIDESSGLSLISYDYDGLNYGLLGYKNENTVKNENGSVNSFIVGKKCISIMANVIEVNTSLNKSILVDLVSRLRNSLNGDNSEIVITNEDTKNPYIISKNNDYIFIDYVTGCKNTNTKAVYYRIIIQDAKDLNIEIPDDGYASLPDYLPKLLEVLEIPQKELGVYSDENMLNPFSEVMSFDYLRLRLAEKGN